MIIAGVIVLIAAVLGVALIAQSFSGTNNAPTTQASDTNQSGSEGASTGDSNSEAGGNGSNGSNTDQNGRFPNEPESKMLSEITRLIRTWHQDVNSGNFGSAWNALSDRKQRQISNDRTGIGTTGRYPAGRSSWQTGQQSLVGELDARFVDVGLARPRYPDEGVMSIYVSNMPYFGDSSACDWSGYTWVRYEGGRWKYEPGFQTTSERNDDWASREGETLGVGCSG